MDENTQPAQPQDPVAPGVGTPNPDIGTMPTPDVELPEPPISPETSA